MAHQSSTVVASVTSFSPEPKAHHNKPEAHKDTMPSDYQPPGVDATPRPEEEIAEALSS